MDALGNATNGRAYRRGRVPRRFRCRQPGGGNAGADEPEQNKVDGSTLSCAGDTPAGDGGAGQPTDAQKRAP